MSTPSANKPAEATKGSLLVIFLIVMIDLLGFGMVLPLLPIYGQKFAEMHGLSEQQAGWMTGILMGSFSAMQLLFVPLWGRLSDRVGRRPVLIIGLVGSTVFYAMFGLATVYGSLVGLFISRIGAGIAGATIATAQAYIADTTSKENRAKGMALVGLGFALGFILGPVIGGVALLAPGDLALSPWPGFFAAGLSASALTLALFKLPESLRPGVRLTSHGLASGRSLKAALSTPSIGLLLVTSFLAVFCFANFETTLSRQVKRIFDSQQALDFPQTSLASLVHRIQGWGYEKPEDIQLIVVYVIFAYLGLVLTLAQGVLVRRLAGAITEGSMALWGAALAVIGFVLMAWAAQNDSFSQFLWSMPVEVTGFALVNPALQSLISRRSDPAQQGSILGLSQTAGTLARSLGPIVALRAFTSSPDWPYWIAAVLLLPGLGMIFVAARSGHDYGAGDLPVGGAH